jgi:hypothetical protein
MTSAVTGFVNEVRLEQSGEQARTAAAAPAAIAPQNRRGVRLRFIEIHERCAVAQNGAPDCATAAATACRVKGYGDDHPVNVQSSGSLRSGCPGAGPPRVNVLKKPLS